MMKSSLKTLTVPAPRHNAYPAHLYGYRFLVPVALKRSLKIRKKVKPSIWASRHRVLTHSRFKGLWRKDVNPYLNPILDAADHRSVETIIICAAPQVGKTEAVHTYLGYAMDMAPGPVLSIYPNEKQAREACKDRIVPMVKSSPRLAECLTGLDDDVSSYRIRLRHMNVFMAWANSAAQLGDRSVRYVDFQETDKYPEVASKKETDPISLGEKRARTYRGIRKIFKSSTPTTEVGAIWQAFTMEADVRFDLHVRCPLCDYEHVMIMKNIRWPEDERDSFRIYSKNLAWYECPTCGGKWDDFLRDKAVARSTWRARDDEGLSISRHLLKYHPKAIAFHIPSWVSQFVTLSEPAAAFLKGQKSKTALKDFMNAHEAMPWVHYEKIRKEDQILALADDRPRGLVPGAGAIAGLTAGVDTQDHGFYYEIRAWGWGVEMESWQVREGFVDTFPALKQVLFDDEYLDSDKNAYIIHFVVQDAMGHRTTEVYDWAREFRGRLWAFKGEPRMSRPFDFTQLDTYPGKKKTIPGGLQLLRANVNLFKDKLSGKLDISQADPGAWHMHSEVSLDWARQMCVEYVNKEGLWECPKGKSNHAWDVSVYNLVAADVIGLKYWKQPKKKKDDGPKPRPQGKTPWIQHSGGTWMGRG